MFKWAVYANGVARMSNALLGASSTKNIITTPDELKKLGYALLMISQTSSKAIYFKPQKRRG